MTNGNNLSNHNCEESQIWNFYKDKTVFMTGGTGFMGKILLEKLLRSTDVSMIYLLIRDKRGKGMHVRMEELFDNIIFQRLKAERPQFKHRVTPIGGDIAASGLAINIDDRRTIATKANILIHLAATVRFDVNLKRAYAINCKSTHEIVNLCKEITNLDSAIYVSTAYSNCHLDDVDETIYDNPIDYLKLEDVLGKLNEKEVEEIMPTFLGNWPNTYTFTKSLAESVIKREFTNLPIGIFRPGIVVSTYKEPIEAWVDNFYGPTGMVAGSTSGLIRTILCDDIPANIVPVDVCIAGLMASVWDVAKRGRIDKVDDLKIYNYVSSTDNPIYWSEFVEMNYMFHKRHPFSKAIWTPTTQLTANKYVYFVYKLFLHYLPAVLMDVGLLMMLKRPRAIGEYRKIHKLMGVIEYFATKRIEFANANLKRLWATMNRADRKLFPMNIAALNWMDYMRNYNKGVCLYLLKDGTKDPNETVKRAKRLQLLHNCCKYLFVTIVVNLIWSAVLALFRW